MKRFISSYHRGPFSIGTRSAGAIRPISTFENTKVQIIDSTCYIGMFNRTNRPLPIHVRSSLIERLFRAGVQNVQAGNLNCNIYTPNTKDILIDLKDVKYGERILSSAVLTPSMALTFLTTGADEAILPVDLSLPYPKETLALFDQSVKQLREQNFNVRIQLDGAFEYCPSSLHSLLQHCMREGYSHVSVLDSENKANPAAVSVLCNILKKSFYSDRIAFGFNNRSFAALGNLYTALDENIRCFYTSVNGLGDLVDTNQLIMFLNYNGYSHDITSPEQIEEIKWWLHGEMLN